MAEIKYEIIETLAVLSESSKGWKKELNLISWNGREPKYDLREWSEDHTKMGKGVTFTLAELQILNESLNKLSAID
ncbi:YdbC family protein [Lysinibacillus sp. NPDC097287]|uniref:YdbC family protein n=1 Tax=Lysinibacillus sp. NPDC097287 TaxID=3364144 RepID=UPI003818CFA2